MDVGLPETKEYPLLHLCRENVGKHAEYIRLNFERQAVVRIINGENKKQKKHQER